MSPNVDIKQWRLRKKSVENQLIESLTAALKSKNVAEFSKHLKTQLQALEQLYQELPNANSNEIFSNRRLRKFFGDMCKLDKNAQFISAFLVEIPIVNEILVQIDNQYPLHIAVHSNAFEIVKTLLGVVGINVNVLWKNKTPLMLLLQNVTPDNYESVKRTIELLAQNKADINISDYQMHPLSVICRSTNIDENKKHELIKLCKKNFSCDVDSIFDGQARKDIEALFKDIHFEQKQTVLTTASFMSQLLKGNEADFVAGFQNLYQNLTADNVGDSCDLLYQASAKNRVQCVEAILAKFKQPEVVLSCLGGKKKIVEAIKLVCGRGYARVLKLYLNNLNNAWASIFNEVPLVLICVRKLYRKETADITECLSYLLNDDKIKVDKADHLGMTALHFALQYDMDSVAIKILTCKRTPYIGQLNRFSKSPLHLMNAAVLKEYLDSCISAKDGILDDIKEIIINLKGFAPPPVQNCEGMYTGGPSQATVENGIKAATELLLPSPLTNHEIHRRSSVNKQHPTKRTNLRRQESIYAIPPNEIEPFEYIANSKELRPLLRHPTLNTILLVKWFQIQWILYTKFALSVVQATLFTLYAIVAQDSIWYNVLRASCFMFIVCFIAVFLLMILKKDTNTRCHLSLDLPSIKGRINYSEVLIAPLALACVTIWNHDNTPLSILIVLSGINIVLHMGSLPFATLSSSIVMLETVSRNFFKSILIYVVILVAFGFGFFVLFATSNAEPELLNDSNTNETKSDDSSDDFSKFKTLTNSLVKSLVMLTGEFDAASFDFKANGASYLLFLGFVFLVALVIANLINGIAVSDISVIRQEAEILAMVKKVETLAHYERVDKTFNIAKFLRNKLAFFSLYNPELIIHARLGYEIEVNPKQGPPKSFYRWPLTKSLCDWFNIRGRYKLNVETVNTIQEILDTRKSCIPEVDGDLKSYDRRLARLEEKLDQLIALIGGESGGGTVGVELESSAQKRWKRVGALITRCRSSGERRNSANVRPVGVSRIRNPRIVSLNSQVDRRYY